MAHTSHTLHAQTVALSLISMQTLTSQRKANGRSWIWHWSSHKLLLLRHRRLQRHRYQQWKRKLLSILQSQHHLFHYLHTRRLSRLLSSSTSRLSVDPIPTASPYHHCGTTMSAAPQLAVIAPLSHHPRLFKILLRITHAQHTSQHQLLSPTRQGSQVKREGEESRRSRGAHRTRWTIR